jgi:radical SAM superfamily enzyme YgiQ (UPF0313 family)
MTDILFVTPNNSTQIYQTLAGKYSAIEPPTWALLLAESCRAKGHSVKIMDTLAECISDTQVVDRLKVINPSIICFVVYGQNVNAGTANMSGAVRLADHIKGQGLTQMIGFIGSHVQALPKKTLEIEKSIDFVFLNEGVCSLLDLLANKAFEGEALKEIGGLAMRRGDDIFFTGPPKVVSQDQMDIDMPGYAWDLLPFKEKPLDLYRSPYWHAQYLDDRRSPYAAIQTSIGCQFKCGFCMINLINKDDTAEISRSSDYTGMRHWSIDLVEKELRNLIAMGVKTIRITDEMFLLNKKYYLPIVNLLKDLNKNDDLYLWAYSRIDTVPNPTVLADIRKAGFRWLCLGIESGEKSIRLEVAKGKFDLVDVEKVVQQVEDAGIHVMANYIFGLPGDTESSIQATYDLSTRLNTLGWNTYAAMALPGSPLYTDALTEGIVTLPTKYEEFSFHSYDTIPLPTTELRAARILQLRDEKFTEYFNRIEFLEKISDHFGQEAVDNILEMNKKRLTRRIIEEDKELTQ